MESINVVVIAQVVILLFCHQIPEISGQNGKPISSGFDTNYPIIYQNTQPRNERSHFGFSLTMTKTEFSRNEEQIWLFIGDPKGNSTDPTYANTPESGVIWRCRIDRSESSSKTRACHIMHLDPIGDYCSWKEEGWRSGSCNGVKPAYEYHTGSWVGGTLGSNSNRMVTCAHRWYRGKGGRTAEGSKGILMNGLCYWFDKSQNSIYTNGSTVNIGTPNIWQHRLIPFFERDPMKGQWRDYWDSSYGRRNSLPVLASAVAGMSIHLRPTADNSPDELLMGAPGTYDHQGSIVRFQDDGRQSEGHRRLNAKADDPKFRKFRTVKLNYNFKRNFNSYFGYAVTSGKYFDNKTTWYAGGSPKANLLEGQVSLFQFPTGSPSESIEYAVQDIDILNPKPQLGSYFGSVLLSANVNGDRLGGLDELFVGAPLQNAIPSAKDNGDHGAVFVFYKEHLGSNKLASLMLTGSNYNGARFGYAMTCLEDINADGYKDIAIGAPFEEPENSGAIYIFYGKEDLGNKWEFGLRIAAKDYSSPIPLKGFGCTFSNALDIDGNGSPDIAIGAFLSKSVVILRTRRILHIEVSARFFNAQNKSISTVDSSIQSFIVETCVQLKNYLKGTLGTEGGQIVLKTNISSVGNSCSNFSAIVAVKNLRETSDLPAPVVLEQFVEYKGVPKLKNHPEILVFNISKNGEPADNSKEVSDFCDACPYPASKSSKLYLPFSDCKDNTTCKPDLRVNLAWFELGDKNVTSVELDWTSTIILKIHIENYGEIALNPHILVEFNTESNIPPQVNFGSSDCRFEHGGKHMLTCGLGQPIKSKELQKRIFEIPFTLNEIYATKSKQILRIDVLPYDKNGDIKLKGAQYSVTLDVVTNARIILIGSEGHEKDALDIGSKFYQEYRVILIGRSPIAGLQFEFDFPIQSKAFPDAELLVEEPKASRIKCWIDRSSGSHFSFTQLSSSEDDSSELEGSSGGVPTVDTEPVLTNSRRRRDTQTEDSKKSSQMLKTSIQDKGAKTLLDWRCDEEFECMKLICELHNFQPGEETISFQMKLEENTTGEVFKEIPLIRVESFGSVQHALKISESSTNDSFTVARTFVRSIKVQVSESTPTWVYIASGIGGLILLVLAMIGLYMAGFFKRSAKQQLEELKAHIEVQQAIAESRRASAVEESANLHEYIEL